MMRRIAPAVLALSLWGCGPDLSPYRATVEAALKDPGSVQYRNDAVTTNAEGFTHYCGEANAKNAFGGYTGFRRFIASNQTVLFEDASQSSDAAQGFDAFWRSNCKN